MDVIVANIRMIYSNNTYPFKYVMNPSGDDSYRKLSNSLYIKLDVSDRQDWDTYESLPSIVNDVVVFPDPVFETKQNHVNFRLPSALQPTATLYVFSSSMSRIAGKELQVVNLRNKTPTEPGIIWDCRDDNGDQLPSGVYVFAIQVDGNTYKGKFAVIKE